MGWCPIQYTTIAGGESSQVSVNDAKRKAEGWKWIVLNIGKLYIYYQWRPGKYMLVGTKELAGGIEFVRKWIEIP